MRLILSFLLGLASLAPAEAVKRYVTLDGARLLSKPQAFASSYGSLRRGQVVWAEPAKAGYLKVRVEVREGQKLRQSTGYLSRQAVQKDKPKLSARYVQSSDASAEEVAAATKGFNKQVEAQYAKDKKLDYDTLDKLLKRTTVADPEGALADFKEKGRLGEYSEAANE